MKKILSTIQDASVNGMLRAGFLALGAMILMAGLLVWNDTREISHELHDFHDVDLKAALEIEHAMIELVQAQQFITDAALTHATEPVAEAQHAASAFRKAIESLTSLLDDADEATELKKALLDIGPKFEQLLSSGLEMVEIYKSEGHQAGNRAMESFDQRVSVVHAEMEKISGHILEHMSSSLQSDLAHMESFQLTFSFITLFLLGLCAIIYVAVSRGISSRISKVHVVLREWASGSMEPRITEIKGTGEIAEMSWAVNNVGDQVETLLREILSSLEQLSAGNLERRVDTRALSTGMLHVANVVNETLDSMAAFKRKAVKDQQRTDEFEVVISEISEQLQTLSVQADDTADALAAMASESSAQASNVVTGAQQASDNVSTVAAATEELTASIAEVSRQVAEAAKVAQEAVTQADKTTETVNKLGEESQEIGSVIQVISDIAEQTNLLALNASIEAARAGEAGRGFAVVADEVKELASETARATEQIARQVKEIQSESADATGTIEAISAIIHKINDINGHISISAEEQSQAALEISSSIQSANNSVHDVTSNISDVAMAMNETGKSASELSISSEDLKQTSIRLAREVKSFLHDLDENSAQAKS